MSRDVRLEKFKIAGGKIREINRHSDLEISLVASRMRQTLIDVLGEQKGRDMYTMDWLKERVLWHLDPTKSKAKIFLSENAQFEITGHAIARVERDESGIEYGYFSTIYVDSESRRQGIATALMETVERWFVERQMPKMIYNTATTNTRLIGLFNEHGYGVISSEGEMVQLMKVLRPNESHSNPSV